LLLIFSNTVVLLAFLSKSFRNQIPIACWRKFVLLPCSQIRDFDELK